MALVDYPSSDEEESEVNPTPTLTPTLTPTPRPVKDLPDLNLKRKRVETVLDLPPLPSKFHDLYASTTRRSTRDEPSLHEGRKRLIPHIEGNWPTHLYIECMLSTSCTTMGKDLADSIEALQERDSREPKSKVHSLVTSDIGVPLPLHVSLSRSLGFLAPQKDDFVDSLRRAVKESGIRPFNLSFNGLKWVANFEGTRWFLVLRIPRPEEDGLNKLLHVCNSTVKQYGQPPLYPKPPSEPLTIARKKEEQRRSARFKRILFDTPSRKTDWTQMQDATDAFHVSLAWTLQSPSDEILELTEMATKDHLDGIQAIQLRVEEIKCKVGNVVTSMPLPISISDLQ
ncbi:hypothetical protein MBM_03987 [Drepanopeziza brunnea f. sp. 'multigermtubi' MB_m1]|uniref:U6 snRNA phosphodiesterase n=1 Tax=Marssonina brunnea f. sp. multigermtubi (strain MB_m1) TaxID=1072389 RepID=K1WKN4_MARBU|nr:uncharacterized protein MBM_03987 [Drepanopeziza brunnea f. sp. 'multigermtubi' MB_m1]EKD18215.1 hypothetical protein MBM_03987 [Drepanopeziza brunnea f. sp. 'multigermtubi' MB_m1]